MENFDTDTRVTPINPTEFRATLSPRWEIWGPNGGYVSSIILRAVGAACPDFLPVSYSCQYLNVAAFDDVIIRVNCLKVGRTSQAFEATLLQNDKIIIKALVWVALRSEGLVHNHVSAPHSWKPLSDLSEQNPSWGYRFWDNFDIRSLEPEFNDARKANGGIAANWFRYIPDVALTDPFLNAARSLVLIDTMQWPAAFLAHDEGTVRHVAPSLDLTVHFHDCMRTSPWLFCEALSHFAGDGLISGGARVWDVDGNILASGGSQLFCKRMK